MVTQHRQLGSWLLAPKSEYVWDDKTSPEHSAGSGKLEEQQLFRGLNCSPTQQATIPTPQNITTFKIIRLTHRKSIHECRLLRLIQQALQLRKIPHIKVAFFWIYIVSIGKIISMGAEGEQDCLSPPKI